MTSLDQWSHAADAPLPAGRGMVRITPTRRHIDNRFPVLGFTVDTGGRPFFEVLLATDRALFDPANASRRTPSSFYASREHSGLIRGGEEPAVYLVPAAVMQRFAGGREIFYTVACYESPQGQDPAYAIPPNLLPRDAPSVEVASDFHGKTLAASFAIPGRSVLRVRDGDAAAPAVASAEGFVAPSAAPSPGSDADADADRAGGEDGYGMTAALDQYDDGYGAMAHGYAEEPDEDDSYAQPASQSAAAALDADDGYDDGYGEPIAASAQQSSYATGAPVPAMLDDEDEERREHDGTYASEAAAYGDEADDSESGGAAAALQSAPGPLAPREQRRIMDTVLALNYPCPSSYSLVIPATDPSPAWPQDGLSFGIVPFNQSKGTLGELLKTMEQRDPRACVRIFDTKWRDLVHAVNDADPQHRMAAVDGKELWREPWLSRFKQAGEHPPFQAAQNETAAKLFLQPVIPFAKGLGLNTDRGLAMLASILLRLSATVSMSNAVRDTLQAAVDAVSPFATRAQEQQALAAVGTAFQQAHHLDPSKPLHGEGHLALLAELRAHGNSPVPLPARTQMLDALVQHVGGLAGGADLARLRTLTCLTDAEYTL